MRLISPALQYLVVHPWRFLADVYRAFGRNQGWLQAGAVAYYALLSLVPLMILSVVAFSHLVDRDALLQTLARYLEWLVPSQSKAVLADVASFMDNRSSIGVVLLVTLLFFSSLTFSILQKAMAQIFAHRHAHVARHPLVSALLPYSFVVALGLALLAITIVSIALQSLAGESLNWLGRTWSLQGVSGLALYGLGIAAEIGILTLFYLLLPVGRTRLSHALLGAVTVTLLWDALRHGLVWYFATLSKASVVYGSLTTAVVVLFSMELAATLLLFGAQVIAEYEQLEIRLGAGAAADR